MINDVLIEFQLLIEKASLKLQAIGEEEWSYKPHRDKWSKKEILGHLIDSATNNHHRFVRAQYQDAPTIVYDQDTWVYLSNYQHRISQDLISFWTSYNQHLIFLIGSISENNLTKTCYNGVDSVVTLAGLAKDYVAHLEHHLKQIIDL